MINLNIDYGAYKITKKHKKEINDFIALILNTYSLNKVNFKLKFKKMYNFGTCFPSWKIFKREVIIYINKDLLKKEFINELKGVLAHEFAHFFHFVNFSQKDYFIFLFKIACYTYSRKLSKNKINLYPNFVQTYEQFTDLTACKFKFSRELFELKKYIPIYRKNIPQHLVPKSSNYLNEKFLTKIEQKELNLQEEIKMRYDKLNLSSLK
jgi:hypothetical protein